MVFIRISPASFQTFANLLTLGTPSMQRRDCPVASGVLGCGSPVPRDHSCSAQTWGTQGRPPGVVWIAIYGELVAV